MNIPTGMFRRDVTAGRKKGKPWPGHVKNLVGKNTIFQRLEDFNFNIGHTMQNKSSFNYQLC